jgi:hypothetical protein
MSLTVESSHYYSDQSESVISSHDSDSDDKEGDKVTFKADHPAALSSVGQVTLVHEWRLIFDVVLRDNDEEVSTYVVERFSFALFKTLFQRIISPNAP